MFTIPVRGGCLEEDKKLVAATLAGDSQAFGEIVKKYQRPLYFLALRMLHNPQSADDVTQKAFLKAYRALAGFQFKSSLKTWLMTIALNLCRTELARPKREEAEEWIEDLPDTSMEQRGDQEEMEEQRAQLRRAMEKLPPRQREVVVLRIHQEMPFQEIAEVLNSTESAVKVNFHHAMKSLRLWVQSQEQNERL